MYSVKYGLRNTDYETDQIYKLGSSLLTLWEKFSVSSLTYLEVQNKENLFSVIAKMQFMCLIYAS